LFSDIFRNSRFGNPLAMSMAGYPHLNQGDSDVDFAVAREILRFYLRNPEAADSVEGLARWRLLDERIFSTLDQIARTVAWLVAHDFLVKERTSPLREVFRLNESEREKIETFLRLKGASKDGRGQE